MTTGIYIGRFQPFHKGHELLLKTMLNQYDETILFIGMTGADERTIKDPFTYHERMKLILNTVDITQLGRIHVEQLFDRETDAQWVYYTFYQAKAILESRYDAERTYLWCGRGSEQQYMKMFNHTWHVVGQDHYSNIHATDIRSIYFHPTNGGWQDFFVLPKMDINWESIAERVPATTLKFLMDFKNDNTPEYIELLNKVVKQDQMAGQLLT